MSPSTAPVYARYLDPNRTWLTNKRLFLLNAWIVLLLATSSTNGFDASMMNGLQSIPQWDDYFQHPRGAMLGLLTAVQNVGTLVALPFAPRLLDRQGRRRSILVGVLIMCAATAAQTAAWSVGVFVAARFFIGFGLSFAQAAAPVLIAEISYPTYRGQFTSAYNSLWYSGSILAAWTTFYSFKIDNTWAWRLPSLLQGLPSLIQLLLIPFAPESPRWLVSQHREQEALETLAYYHASGDTQDPLVRFEFDEIKTAIDLDRRLQLEQQENDSPSTRHCHHQPSTAISSLFSTPGNRKRMTIILALAFFSQWSGNGLVSFYLKKVFEAIGITHPPTQLRINGLLQLWNLLWALGASFLVDRAGRRPLFLASATGMLVCFALQTACAAAFAATQSTSAAYLDVLFIFLFYASYDLAFSPLVVSYTLEILPYRLRARGFAAFHVVLSLSVVVNQYVNAVALEWFGWRYYLVYVGLLAFEVGFLYFRVVETKGRTLEETAALFDDEDGASARLLLSGPEDDDDDEREGLLR